MLSCAHALACVRACATDKTPAPITVDYPTEATVYPPDLVPPTFSWHDPDPAADRWRIEVSGVGGGPAILLDTPSAPPDFGAPDPRCFSETNEPFAPTPYQASARTWTPSSETWAQILSLSPVRVALSGFASRDPGRVLSRGEVRLEVSPDPIDAPVFYRDVPLMPSKTEVGTIKPLAQGALPLVAWRMRDLSRPESRVVLERLPTCGNCHSFSRDGRTLGMDLDGPGAPDIDKGAYALVDVAPTTVIREEDVFSWNAFPGRPPGKQTIGFLSRVSPDGRHVVSTVNEEVYVANFANHRFLQVFYPTRGILAVFARDTGELMALPGADDPAYVHCDPVWTPDGEHIVFARAAARDPYRPGVPLATHANDPNETPIRYDLYRIPFSGGHGGTAVPITGASGNGMSNTFPKVSPDGRWLVFVKCANGQLMRPDSRLWIVPASGGAARELSCNAGPMNSWHSFSPNGRWLVFSSKRNTPYTQMFLTHLDAFGEASPAVLVPNSTASNRAVNLPEFVGPGGAGLARLDVPAVADRGLYERAAALSAQGRFSEALPLYRQVVKLEPAYAEALVNLGVALEETGAREEAVGVYRRALEVRPNDTAALGDLCLALARLGRAAEAVAHCEAAVRLDPGASKRHHDLGVALVSLGRLDAAISAFDRAIGLDGSRAEPLVSLGLALARQGKAEQALSAFSRALEKDPGSAPAHANLGVVLAGKGRHDEALPHFREAARLRPGRPRAQYDLALALARSGSLDEARIHLEAALGLDPSQAQAHASLGLVLAQLGREDEALAHLDAALRLEPGHEEARLQRARLLHDRRLR